MNIQIFTNIHSEYSLSLLFLIFPHRVAVGSLYFCPGHRLRFYQRSDPRGLRYRHRILLADAFYVADELMLFQQIVIFIRKRDAI